jgi:hypothetical protein
MLSEGSVSEDAESAYRSRQYSGADFAVSCEVGMARGTPRGFVTTAVSS